MLQVRAAETVFKLGGPHGHELYQERTNGPADAMRAAFSLRPARMSLRTGYRGEWDGSLILKALRGLSGN